MSLFGSFFGMDDPFMMGPSHMMREMDAMANAMMQGSFPMLMPRTAQRPVSHSGAQALMPFGGFGMMPMGNPFGFSSMQLGNISSGHSQVFSSSSVTTISTGPDGRPLVYQATSSSRTGPNGVQETRKTVSDSRAGVKKMAIGRHLGDRSHVMEKEQNLQTGEIEEKEDLVNLDEEDVPEFDVEWTRRAYGVQRPRHIHGAHASGQSQNSQRHLAITAGPSSHGERPSHRERSTAGSSKPYSGSKRHRSGK